jgi:hypothetical protein
MLNGDRDVMASVKLQFSLGFGCVSASAYQMEDSEGDEGAHGESSNAGEKPKQETEVTLPRKVDGVRGE